MEVRALPEGLFSISHPGFSPVLRDLAKSIPGMSWNPELRSWTGFPDAVEAVANLLLARKIIVNGMRLLADAFAIREPMHVIASKSKRGETIRKYQVEGVRFLLNRGRAGCVLAFTMGTGKTPVGVLAARALGGRTVVVCPASIRGTTEDVKSWHRELAGWYPKAKLFFPEGVSAKKVTSIPEDVDVIVINYDILYAWLDVILEWNPRFAILDEGHILSGKNSRRSLACAELRSETDYFCILTGTPMLNYPKDLWGVVSVLCPGRFGDPEKGFFKFGFRYCCPPDAPIWMADGSFKPIGDIRAGDKIIGWDAGTMSHARGRRGPRPGVKHRKLIVTTVTHVGRRVAKIVRLQMESGQVVRCTPDHKWLAGHHNKLFPWTRPIAGHCLSRVIFPTPELPRELERTAGWLGGMFDGEGSVGTNGMSIAQSESHNPAVCAALDRAFVALGIPYTKYADGSTGCSRFQIIGGRPNFVKFINWCKPARIEKCRHVFLGSKIKTPERVISIEDDGVSEVVSLTTESGNYVVYGLASKNCDAHQVEIEAIGKTVWDFSGISNAPELKRRFEWFMLRKQMSDPDVAMELPPKVRVISWVEQNKKASARGNRMMTNKRELRAALDAAADAKLEPVLRTLVSDGYAPGGRVVACWRKAVCAMVAESYRAAGLTNVEIITGEVPQKEREKRIARARSSGGVLVVTIDSCGLGIDLTFASQCDIIEFVYEPWKLVQLEGRLHRFGQNKNTVFRYFAMAGSADELVVSRVVEKLGNIEAIVGTSDEEKGLREKLSGGDMSEEEILQDIFAGVGT